MRLSTAAVTDPALYTKSRLQSATSRAPCITCQQACSVPHHCVEVGVAVHCCGAGTELLPERIAEIVRGVRGNQQNAGPHRGQAHGHTACRGRLADAPLLRRSSSILIPDLIEQ